MTKPKILTTKKLDALLSEAFNKAIDVFSILKNYQTFLSMKVQHSIPFGISPTDKDARGMYAYQEPEIDEQGTYYGYKVLHKRSPNPCPCEERSAPISPRYYAKWLNGELTSDREPDEKTMYGIHFTKSPEHPELHQYTLGRASILVKCALSGTVVETEQGFRAQHAQIVGVYYNGNWQSYQDYQRRSRPDPYRNPYAEEEWRRFQW